MTVPEETYHVGQNSRYPRCVDGRAAEVFVEWRSGNWVVSKRGDDARAENGPQFLGGSLLFVRALEVVGRQSRVSAFYLTEQVSQQVGLGLQVHVDDHNGLYDIASMNDADLIDLVQKHHTGCGFAEYAWAEESEMVIVEAKRRHWRLQFLKGDHAERGAVISYRVGETFDTASAAGAGTSQYNLDVVEARQVFERLEVMTVQPGFAARAEDWMVSTYKDMVVKLKGVLSPRDVLERR
jgi:hypothetical protein